jgi:hypothetical protein
MNATRYELTAIALFSEQTTIHLTCGDCPADVAVAATWPQEDGIPIADIQQAIENHDRLHTIIDKTGNLCEAEIAVADGRTVLHVTTSTRSGTIEHPRWQETATTSGTVLAENADYEVTDDRIAEVLAGLGFTVVGPWQSAGLRYVVLVVPTGTLGVLEVKP